ncbi:ferritin-like domain-containing protein [Curvibacter sp. APW13]|uniref:ferritin-like domain-containing protein n=1 Tax=Curvibacter sp. APW13 TaxID=3077236 RepID=UPI0028DE65DF|nr:ferritin-like domain-containing protein [Curvibacter sp. APW13]MDT8992621.1 ferritin-like domain-containing protein [Curvibacter sp. APW13]
MSKKTDFTEIKVMRRAARKNLKRGAVTADYKADRDQLIKQLNEALATELVCVLRYRRHYFMAKGIHSRSVAAEFLAHSNEELGHADSLAARIVQLGGEPDFSPVDLASRSHVEYIAAVILDDMIRENLVAERIAIHSYRQTIDSIADRDPTTSDLLKRILAVEEEHADDMSSLLDSAAPE